VAISAQQYKQEVKVSGTGLHDDRGHLQPTRSSNYFLSQRTYRGQQPWSQGRETERPNDGKDDRERGEVRVVATAAEVLRAEVGSGKAEETHPAQFIKGQAS
jgi:hypothetical protein